MLMDVVGFDGYKVDSNGNIFSFKRYPEGKLISPYVDKDGYLCVSLRTQGTSKAQKVHRVVAKAFISNPNDFPQVNHKDANKKNNTVENLEWVTNTQNQRHAWINDLKTIKLTIADVLAIKNMLNYNTNTFIAKIFKVDPSTISNIRTEKIS